MSEFIEAHFKQVQVPPPDPIVDGKVQFNVLNTFAPYEAVITRESGKREVVRFRMRDRALSYIAQCRASDARIWAARSKSEGRG